MNNVIFNGNNASWGMPSIFDTKQTGSLLNSMEIGSEPTGSRPMNVNFVTNEEKKVNNKILFIDEIEVGAKFSGLVYVVSCINNVNKFDEEKFNVSMKLVDGKGKIFTATIFEVEEKLNLSNTVIKINKGYCTNRFDGRIFYNITDFLLNKDITITSSMFMKSIPNIQDEIVKLLNYVTNSSIFRCHPVINSFGAMNIFNSLETRIVSDTKGTKLGSPIKYLNIIFDYCYNSLSNNVNFASDVIELSIYYILYKTFTNSLAISLGSASDVKTSKEYIENAIFTVNSNNISIFTNIIRAIDYIDNPYDNLRIINSMHENSSKSTKNFEEKVVQTVKKMIQSIDYSIDFM